jgi:hypothetical protein
MRGPWSTALLVLALAPAAPAEERARLPEGTESLELGLERAVARVSAPHARRLLGEAGTTRGYRLPGYGVVFVLPPRALSGEPATLVLGGSAAGRAPRVQVRRRFEVRAPEPEAHEIEALERQVLMLQQEAEALRRAAEEDMERIAHDVRVILAPAPRAAPVPAPEPAPEAEPPPEPAAPPWLFWFEARGSDERTDDAVVAEVRSALVAELEAAGGRLSGLGPEEFVTVAVDFIPGGLFTTRARPSRTLVVRARQSDLAARARGALGPAELRRRLEIVEY